MLRLEKTPPPHEGDCKEAVGLHSRRISVTDACVGRRRRIETWGWRRLSGSVFFFWFDKLQLFEPELHRTGQYKQTETGSLYNGPLLNTNKSPVTLLQAHHFQTKAHYLVLYQYPLMINWFVSNIVVLFRFISHTNNNNNRLIIFPNSKIDNSSDFLIVIGS